MYGKLVSLNPSHVRHTCWLLHDQSDFRVCDRVGVAAANRPLHTHASDFAASTTGRYSSCCGVVPCCRGKISACITIRHPRFRTPSLLLDPALSQHTHSTSVIGGCIHASQAGALTDTCIVAFPQGGVFVVKPIDQKTRDSGNEEMLLLDPASETRSFQVIENRTEGCWV